MDVSSVKMRSDESGHLLRGSWRTKIGDGCDLSENEERRVRRSIAGIMEDNIGDGCELSESDEDHGGQGWRWM